MTREFVIVACDRRRWRRLPVHEVTWLADQPKAIERTRDACGRGRSYVTLPGYRAGEKPANWGKRYHADPPTNEEFGALLDELPTCTVAGARNRALLVFMRRTGLRVMEACNIVAGDLDFEACSVLVREGKGGKTARCGIDRMALNEINAWMLIRAIAGYTLDQPLFCAVEGPTKGGRVREAYVRQMMKHYARKAGIVKRIHPHGLRHALAVELVRRKVPMPYIQRQLRHSSLATTATYLQSIAPEDLYEVMADLRWSA